MISLINKLPIKLITLLFTRGTGLILTFSVSLFLARFFGSSITGKYYLFLSILTGISVITKFGFNSTLIKFCAHHSIEEEKEKIRGYWYTTSKVSIVLSLCIIILIISIAEIIRSTGYMLIDYEILTYLFIALIPFTILGHNIAILVGLNHQATASITESIALPGLFLFLVVIFYFYNSNSEQVIKYYTAAIITVFFISTSIIYKQLHSENRSETINKKLLISTSRPILGINITNFLTDWSATYILGIFGTLSQVGIYNISWRLVTIMGILLIIFNSINAPQYSKDFKKNDINNINITARKTSSILFWLSLPIIISIIIFSEKILSFFGNDFIQGAPILQILAIGQIINFSSGSVGYLLLMTGHEKKLRNLTLGICIFQISTLLIFVPQYNIYAAAIISTITIALKNMISVYLAYKYIGVLSLPLIKLKIKQNEQ